MLRGLKHTLCTPGPRDPTETETQLRVSVSWGGLSQQRPAAGSGALGAIDLGMVWALLGSVTINPTTGSPELTQDWETDSWQAQTEPYVPGPRRKGQWAHRNLTQTCPLVSRSLRWRCGSAVACCRAGGTECSMCAWGLLKKVAIIFITSAIVWPHK